MSEVMDTPDGAYKFKRENTRYFVVDGIIFFKRVELVSYLMQQGFGLEEAREYLRILTSNGVLE